MSFNAGRWSEPDLIGFADASEKTTHVRVPPRFLATTSAAKVSSRLAVAQGNGRAAADGAVRRARLSLR